MRTAGVSTSHLYAGFRCAGALPSVHAQREFQRQVVELIPGEDLFIVGCAFGEEANHILSATDRWRNVLAIDLADIGTVLAWQPALSSRVSGLRWYNSNLLDAPQLPGYGTFDAVQCGFVLHDVPPSAKERAIGYLASAVRIGGHVIISDIFVQPHRDRASNTEDIYDAFLCEASAALEQGSLSLGEWHALVGDGLEPGLLRSRHESLEASRDYFDSIELTVARAESAGLDLQDLFHNPINEHLSVLVFRRTGLKDWTERGEWSFSHDV